MRSSAEEALFVEVEQSKGKRESEWVSERVNWFKMMVEAPRRRICLVGGNVSRHETVVCFNQKSGYRAAWI